MRLLSGILLLHIIMIACKGNDGIKESNTELTADIGKIKMITLRNEPVDLAQFKGKVVFVNFWATWCKPCIEEMPSIKNAMKLLEKEKIEFLFATDETSKEIERFEAKHNFGFNYLKTGNFEELNIIGLPTTFIFDKHGKQVFSEMGYRKWDDKTNTDLLINIVNKQ